MSRRPLKFWLENSWPLLDYLINTAQKTVKPSKKIFQFPGWMRKNFMPGDFSWKQENTKTWDASCFKKGLLEKQESVPNTCEISSLKKIFFQNLTDAFFKYLKSPLYWSCIDAWVLQALNMFLPVCQDDRCDINLFGHM